MMLNSAAWNDDGSCSSLSLSSLNSTTASSMEPTSSPSSPPSSSSSSSASSSSPSTTTTTTIATSPSSGMKIMAKSLSLFPTCNEEEETELRLGLGPPMEANTNANANTNGANNNTSENQPESITISLAAVDQPKSSKPVQDLNLFGHQYCSNNKTQYSVDRPVAASILPTKRSYNDALGPGVMFQGDPNKAVHASTRPPRAPNSSLLPPSPFITNHPDSAPLLKDLPLPKPTEAGSSLNKENTNTARPVVGWPPVRSFRRNTIATNQIKPIIAETETKQQQQQKQAIGSDCSEQESSLFVKANVDGVPIGRKVDLKSYDGYDSLKLALGDMFQRSIHGSEHVLTYEDKDGDWMLVGDVPWDLFLMSVRRLRIMKSSDDIGHGGRSSSKAVG